MSLHVERQDLHSVAAPPGVMLAPDLTLQPRLSNQMRVDSSTGDLENAVISDLLVRSPEDRVGYWPSSRANKLTC